MSDIKPLVIVKDRYNGTYSGGKWTAWNLCYVPSKIFGDAKECADFFSKANLVYGRGETPQEAIDDLKMILDCGISDPDEKDEDEEEEQMEPTSVWKIADIDDIWISQEGDEMSLLLKNRDDLTKIILTGDAIKKHNDEFITILKVDLEEEDKKFRDLEKELGKWKKETADCLRLRDEVRREKNKEINELKWQLQMKGNIIKRKDELREELALEKAANEAQHKFIREYAGKDTEVQFNFAIDDAKEVSYVIVDKEEYNKNFEKWANTQVENAPASTFRADILDQAKKCVCGQREQDYGTPESNFKLIADLWNDYLKKEQSSIVVDAKDVAMMMALMKIARIRNGGGSGDSFVDLAGYAACGGEIWHGQKVKDQN